MEKERHIVTAGTITSALNRSHIIIIFILIRNDMVKISMETFVKRFQPDRYDNWLMGKDLGHHPEEPERFTFAPKPEIDKYSFNKANDTEVNQKRSCTGDGFEYNLARKL